MITTAWTDREGGGNKIQVNNYDQLDTLGQ